ncbi:MAG: DUF4375 domain-containing protein [Planctomycetota bacterium]|nr:DUF4375 domain-containing protein [Planctomycetota bacterium]
MGRSNVRDDATLPSSAAAFRAVVDRCRTEDERKALYERVVNACPVYRALVKQGLARDAAHRTPDARRLEGRLLEFVRTQAMSRAAGRRLTLSHAGAWRDLVHMRSAAFAARLAVWARSADTVLAGEAAAHLAWMGRRRDLARLRKLVASRRAPVVGGVALGAGRAIAHKHAEPGFGLAIARAVRPFLTMEKPLIGKSGPLGDMSEALGRVASLQVAADVKEGLALLAGPAVLRPANPALRAALRELENELPEGASIIQRHVDADAVWSVLDDVRPRALREARTKRGDLGGVDAAFVFGMALVLGAMAEPGRARREVAALHDEPALRARFKHEIAAASRWCSGAPDPQALLRGFMKRPQRFTGVARDVLAAYELAEHVACDGLAVYFHNLGHHAGWAAAGLEAVGLPRQAVLLRKAATRVFGAESAGTLGEARARASSLTPAQDRALERACDPFERQNDDVREAVERYIDRHAEVFSDAAKSGRRRA